MINGAHVIIYSTDAEADRAFFRDILGLSHVDVGDGWLIFGLPPSEVAVHPAGGGGKEGHSHEGHEHGGNGHGLTDDDEGELEAGEEADDDDDLEMAAGGEEDEGALAAGDEDELAEGEEADEEEIDEEEIDEEGVEGEAAGGGRHELYLMCDDIEDFVSRVAARNLECSPVQDQGWGIITQMTLPGGGRLGVYQPRHARPPTAETGAARARKPAAAAKKPAAKAKKAAKAAAPKKAAKAAAPKKAAKAVKKPAKKRR
jgi:catechol 2,3-dioxygenase-like lactoylglutathione lyase family enzyme